MSSEKHPLIINKNLALNKDKIPIILEDICTSTKQKYLLPSNMTGYDLCQSRSIPKYNRAIFIKNHGILRADQTMGEIYKKYHLPDKFLHLYYESECIYEPPSLCKILGECLYWSPISLLLCICCQDRDSAPGPCLKGCIGCLKNHFGYPS